MESSNSIDRVRRVIFWIMLVIAIIAIAIISSVWPSLQEKAPADASQTEAYLLIGIGTSDV